jgi:hypothetical protein
LGGPSPLPRHDSRKRIYTTPLQGAETSDIGKAFSAKHLHPAYRLIVRLTKHARGTIREDLDVRAGCDAKAWELEELPEQHLIVSRPKRVVRIEDSNECEAQVLDLGKSPCHC